MKSVRFAIGLAVLTAPVVFAEASPPAPKRVLIVSCDGLRPDAIERAEAPVMQRLIATGSYQGTCLNELPPITLPNHLSMVTGLRVATHRIYDNTVLPGRVAKTTLFDVATAAELDVGFFINKSKLAYLCPEGSVTVWRMAPDVDALAEEVVAAVSAEDLDLIFVHFGEPDGAGHASGWMSEPYLQQVGRVDAAISRILDGFQAKDILDETVVVISADHGGHRNTHWLPIPADQHIPFIMSGPGVAEGQILCEQVHIMDVAATALYLLGLPIESAADGKPVLEALTPSSVEECAAPTGLGHTCGVFSLLALSPVLALLARRRQRHRF